MTLSAGSRLGPYEIESPIGAGGMGEVYRARDTRLGRSVALKVIRAAHATDREIIQRFEQEARSASALNHPNIVTIYDVGHAEDVSYIAMELIEGDNLRVILAQGAMPVRSLLQVAAQVADGLAAAHEKNIVHRDLKPENIIVTREGLAKILDFGLAKLLHPSLSGESKMATMEVAETDPGTILGTVGYMSPEQASAKPVDYSSDQFSFGAILYEMATGRRAFSRATAVETLSAIIRDEPEAVATINPQAPAPLRWIVERCLAKAPRGRYASTRDLASELQVMRDHLSEVSSVGIRPVTAPRKNLAVIWAAVGAGIAISLLASALLIKASLRKTPPSFQRLTFRRGTIENARFAPDGHTVVYSAAWDGRPVQLYLTRPESPESSAMALPESKLLSIASNGELLLSLRPRGTGSYGTAGTLARAPLAGGAPREVMSDVRWAEWVPGGSEIAVVRDAGGKSRLELPAGHALFETAGSITDLRISPDGRLVAFLEHPSRGDDGGSVAVVDREGHRKLLSEGWSAVAGLSWAPGGREIWFTGSHEGSALALNAVTTGARERLLLRAPGELRLLDVAPDGRVLLAQNSDRQGIVGMASGSRERDLSWLDWSNVRDLSGDGKLLLFGEGGDGGGPNYSVYLRKLDDSPAVRLGDGTAMSLSPDGRWAASMTGPPPGQIVLLPTAAGEPRRLPPDGLNHHWVRFFPDGRRVLLTANAPGHGVRLYVEDLSGGSPRPITPEGVGSSLNPVSPDGRRVAAVAPDGGVSLYAADGSGAVPVPSTDDGVQAIQFGPDGQSLFIYRVGEVPARVYRIDIASGRRELAREFVPLDPAGVVSIGTVRLSADDKSYVYDYARVLSDLYLLRGVK